LQYTKTYVMILTKIDFVNSIIYNMDKIDITNIIKGVSHEGTKSLTLRYYIMAYMEKEKEENNGNKTTSNL